MIFVRHHVWDDDTSTLGPGVFSQKKKVNYKMSHMFMVMVQNRGCWLQSCWPKSNHGTDATIWSWLRMQRQGWCFFTRFFTSSSTRPASLPWFVRQSPLLMWHVIMCKQMKQKHQTYNMHHMFWLLLDLFSYRFSTDWNVESLIALQPNGRTHAAKKRLTDRPTFTAGRMPWFGCDKLRFQFASLHF